MQQNFLIPAVASALYELFAVRPFSTVKLNIQSYSYNHPLVKHYFALCSAMKNQIRKNETEKRFFCLISSRIKLDDLIVKSFLFEILQQIFTVLMQCQ